MHADHRAVMRLSGRQRLEKALATIDGLLVGMETDGHVTSAEAALLRAWMDEHADVARFHPFNEIVPMIEAGLEDEVLSPDEIADIRWLAARILDASYLDGVTREVQALQGLLGGIASDGRVTAAELEVLGAWMEDRMHLKSVWPFDEVEALRMVMLRDGQVDPQEHTQLLAFFAEFTRLQEHRAISPLDIHVEGQVQGGLCAVGPEVVFADKKFCFTGASARAKRREMEDLVQRLGGRVGSVGPSLDFLVVGAEGNPAWAYSCYGRKVEEAMRLRRTGARLTLVHETDFWDAVADHE
ncbi:MAG: BRCT domain-containing protein [Myxococcota bacterium]